MIIFHSDLDSTLIYSDKHEIKGKKVLVESYDGGATYMTQKTLDGLLEISNQILVVPTTTRSEKLYKRINLQGCTFKYALVANGAGLLEDGVASESWKKGTQVLIKSSLAEMEKAEQILTVDNRRTRAIDWVGEAFLFTKVGEIESVVQKLSEALDLSKVVIRTYKEKLYVLPKNLEKGIAIARFRDYMMQKAKKPAHDMKIIAAGDGNFDISMIEAADLGIAYYKLKIPPKENNQIVFLGENELFSDEILDKLKELI